MSQTGNATPPALNRKNKIIDDGEEEDAYTNMNTGGGIQQSTTSRKNKQNEEKKGVKAYGNEGSDNESETGTDSEYGASDSSSSSGEEEEDDGYLWNINEENGKDVATRHYEHRGENKNPTTAVVMQTKKSKKINFPITVKDNTKCSIGVSGYCMIKASHCLESGSYYYEVKIDESVQHEPSKLPDYARQSHYRCGWSLEQGFDKACCGYDKYSFSYGSRDGNCFHKTNGAKYGDNFGVGDIIGCYIEIPEVLPPHIVYIDGSMSLKTGEVFRTKIATLAEKSVPGSKIIFFKNGKFQGVAFSDIPYGAYFPAISLYMNACVTMRFEKNQLEYNPYTICPEHISPDWKPVGDLKFRNRNTQKTPKKPTTQGEFKSPSFSKNNLKEIGKGASKQFHQSPSQNRHSKIASASITENKKPKEKKEKSEKSHHHSGHGDKKTPKKKKESKSSSVSNMTEVKKPVDSAIQSIKTPPVIEKPPIEQTPAVTETLKPEKLEKKKKPKLLKVITDETGFPNKSNPPQDSPRLPPTPSLNQSSDTPSPLIRSASSSSMTRASSSEIIMPPSPSPPLQKPEKGTFSSDKTNCSPSSASSSTMKHSNSFEKSSTLIPNATASSSATSSVVSGNISTNPAHTATTPLNDTTPVNKPFITNMSDKPIVQSSFPSIEQITPQTKERKSKSKSEGSSIMARSKNFTPKKVLSKKEDLAPAKTAPKRKAPSKDEELVVQHHTVKLLDPKDIQQAKKPKVTNTEPSPISNSGSIEKDAKPSSPNKKRKTSKAESNEIPSSTGQSKQKDESKKSESSEPNMINETLPDRIMETIIPKQQPSQAQQTTLPTLAVQQTVVQQENPRNTQQVSSYSLHNNQPTQQLAQQQQVLSYERSNPEPAYSFSNLLLGTNNTKSTQEQFQHGQVSSSSNNQSQQPSQPNNSYYQQNTPSHLSERKQDWNVHQLQTQPNNVSNNLPNNIGASIRNVSQDISPSYQSRISLDCMMSQKQENMRLLEQINNLPKEIQKPLAQSATPISHTPSFRELLESPSTFSSSQISNSNNLLASQSRNVPSHNVMSQLKVGNPSATNYQMNKDQQSNLNSSNGNYSTYGHQQQSSNEMSKHYNQQQAPNNYNQYSQRSNNFPTSNTGANSMNFTPQQASMANMSMNNSGTMNINMNNMTNSISNTMANVSLTSSMANLNQMNNSNTSKYNIPNTPNYSNMNQPQNNTGPYNVGGNMAQSKQNVSGNVMGGQSSSFSQPIVSNQPQHQQQYSSNIPRGFAPQQMNQNIPNHQQFLPGLHQQSHNNFIQQNQPYQQQNNTNQQAQQNNQSSFKYNYLKQ